jgi:two-component system sensor histidine kinase RpfC
MVLRRGNGPPAAPSGDGVRVRDAMAAIALSIVAACVPITLIMLPELRAQIAPPRLGNALLGALLLVPAAVGLTAALSGLQRVARAADGAGRALEQAVLRVVVGALLFSHAVVIGTLSGPTPAGSWMLLTAAAGLVIGWLVLLAAMLRPAASIWLPRGAMLFDASLLSAFLHFGGQEAAGWYPLYLLLTAYAGFRFGIGALVSATALSFLGFAAVAATTEFWQQQLPLTAECGFALLLLPILAQGPVRAIAEARGSAAAVERAKSRFVAVLAETLRAPLMGMPDPPQADRAVAADGPELPPHVADILDLAAIEAGTYAPRTEPFDLHELVNDALVAGHGMAESRGIALRGRIDPYLPYRLRGWRQSFDRILGNLLGHAIETAESGTVQLRLAALGSDDEQVRLALLVEGGGGTPPVIAAAMTDPFASGPQAAGHSAIALALVRRMVELMGGTLTIDTTAAGNARITIELTLAIDRLAAETPLQSAGCPVLIVTGDSVFAGNICEYLGGWDAAVSWIGETDAALNYIAWLDPAVRAVLLVDGRNKPLSAISFVARAAALDGTPPFALFVAEPAQIAALEELEDGEVAAYLTAPLSPQLLSNALHALPLRTPAAEYAPAPAEEAAPQTAAPDDPEAFGDRVTPIAAHPRFAAEPAPIVDQRRLEALRELGGQESFLGDIIETFRTDAQQIMDRLGRAAAVADIAAFARGLRALGQAAGHVGAIPLAQLTASLRGLNATELRDQGSLHLQRLEAEIERLAAALQRYLDPAEAQRP